MPAKRYYRNAVPDFDSMTRIASRIAYLIRDPDYGYEFDFPYDPPCKESLDSVFNTIKRLYESGKIRGGTFEGLFRACIILADNQTVCHKFLTNSTEEKCLPLYFHSIPSRFPLHSFEEQAVRKLHDRIRRHGRRIHPRYHRWVLKAVRHHTFVYFLQLSSWLSDPVISSILEEDLWPSLRR
jgi:hypothetical protein